MPLMQASFTVHPLTPADAAERPGRWQTYSYFIKLGVRGLF